MIAYHQIGNILSIDRSKLENACIQLKIEHFDHDEYEFLQQYHHIMNKVAIALKTLEGDQLTFGVYLPTLFGLRKFLDKCSDSKTTETYECLELAVAIKAGFEKRFAHLMDVFNVEKRSAPLFIAMITNPQYKLNFMGTRTISPSVLREVKEMLVTAGIQIETIDKIEYCDVVVSEYDDDEYHGNGNINKKF